MGERIRPPQDSSSDRTNHSPHEMHMFLFPLAVWFAVRKHCCDASSSFVCKGTRLIHRLDQMFLWEHHVHIWCHTQSILQEADTKQAQLAEPRKTFSPSKSKWPQTATLQKHLHLTMWLQTKWGKPVLGPVPQKMQRRTNTAWRSQRLIRMLPN